MAISIKPDGSPPRIDSRYWESSLRLTFQNVAFNNFFGSSWLSVNSGLFKCMGGLKEQVFLKMPSNEHHTNRQTV